MKLIIADMTANDERIAKDLERSDRRQIPVNLVYPANYPEEPAILLEGLVFASDALEVLERVGGSKKEKMETVSRPMGSITDASYTPSSTH